MAVQGRPAAGTCALALAVPARCLVQSPVASVRSAPGPWASCPLVPRRGAVERVAALRFARWRLAGRRSAPARVALWRAASPRAAWARAGTRRLLRSACAPCFMVARPCRARTPPRRTPPFNQHRMHRSRAAHAAQTAPASGRFGVQHASFQPSMVASCSVFVLLPILVPASCHASYGPPEKHVGDDPASALTLSDQSRSMYHTLSPINTGGGTEHRLAVASRR